MANSNIPLRFQFTGSAVTAVAEYASGETIQHPGNLQLNGAGRRIFGDFSDSTPGNRAFLQTSVANASTNVGVLPSGSGTQSTVIVYNASDPANASRMRISVDGTIATIVADSVGSGTSLPLTMQAGGLERLRLLTAGGAQWSTPLQFNQYTLATLPSAAAYSGYCIDVTNATGGAKICRSDGTNWKILNTTTTVS